jgi:O6-methylguanine-DNA--protein-cysteine methyltransferase
MADCSLHSATEPDSAKERTRKTGAKRRRLNPRQGQFVAAAMEGKSLRQAALEAGYSERTARHPGELMNREAVRETFRRLLPPLPKIALRINQGMDAKYTEFAKHEGKITDEIERVDFAERRQYAELAAKLHDLMPESSRAIAVASAAAIAGAVAPGGTAFEMYEAEWLRERKQEWNRQLEQKHTTSTTPSE